jgi:hypothetical protein
MNIESVPALISTLRVQCEKLDTVDPMSPAYKRMIKLLDSLDQPTLVMIRDARIKFLSKLAINRIKQ